MVVSALYLLAGCAFFGGALQTQQSVTTSGRRSAIHALLAVMWLTLGILAFANSSYMSNAGPDGFISYEALIRITLACQFLLWAQLIWLVVIITHTQLTLIPIVLSGVWLFLLIVSIRIPLELFISTLPQLSQSRASGDINNWWFNIYVVILATFIYCQFAGYQFYNSGQRAISRILAGSLILLLETTVYDLLVTMRLIHSPTITVFGFLVLLILLSFYYLPVKEDSNAGVIQDAEESPVRAETGPSIVTPRIEDAYPPLASESIRTLSQNLMAIDLYAGMGLRRLRRGATETEKLSALFRKVQSEASNGRSITEQFPPEKKQGKKPMLMRR